VADIEPAAATSPMKAYLSPSPHVRQFKDVKPQVDPLPPPRRTSRSSMHARVPAGYSGETARDLIGRETGFEKHLLTGQRAVLSGNLAFAYRG
jgi:hypothetical protein